MPRPSTPPNSALRRRGPAQVIGVGLNYARSRGEADCPSRSILVVFTKFASAIAGPDVDVRLPGDTVDWEAELVVVIGRGGRDMPESEARDRIAGYTVGQDLSERTVQWQGTPAQFSIGKSFENFAPTGPVIATLDEFADPDAPVASRRRSSVRTAPRPGCRTATTDKLIFPIARPRQPPVGDRGAAARRSDLHGHAARGGRGHEPQTVPHRGRDAGHGDRGHRRDHSAVLRFCGCGVTRATARTLAINGRG